MRSKIFRIGFIVIGIVIVLNLFRIVVWPRIGLIGKSTPHKVHVTFGFHASLYHSYRVDTNDDAGFAQDIRVIRNTIKTLDSLNERGIPVKGHWDIDNLFTLQGTLPEYAPDIITDIQRRVKENGDDIVLMSYNNALVSAMTEDEFRASISRAITNKDGSGKDDVFGQHSPIIRPQEMVATPGTFRILQDLGINTVLMYYSSIVFDAFRVFERELTLEEAHNPMLYQNADTGEEIVMMPIYNAGDVIENVSLRRWARELHRAQVRGDIKRDVLIVINEDADDPYWEGYKLPAHLKWVPNTGGLEQMVSSIADLDYVVFSTVTEYLNNNEPAGVLSFGQDTADGSFNGYSSWAEKATTHDYWTRMEAARRSARLAGRLFGKNMPGGLKTDIAQLFEHRLRFLSTTHFGMATPYLARGREQVVRKLSAAIDAVVSGIQKNVARKIQSLVPGAPIRPTETTPESHFISNVYLVSDSEQEKTPSGKLLTVPLAETLADSERLALVNQSGEILPTATLLAGDGSARIHVRGSVPDGSYGLIAVPAKTSEDLKTDPSELSNGLVQISLNENGIVESVSSDNGNRLELEGRSLLPELNFGGEMLSPEKLEVEVLSDGSRGAVTLRLSGEFNLAGVSVVRPGRIDYRISLVAQVPYLFVEGGILYPETPRDDLKKTGRASLTRRLDRRWREVAPLPLRFAHTATLDKPFRVLKRNYVGAESSYTIDYHKHSSENKDLANVNNHITAEYVGLTNGKRAVAVATDTTVQANFAYAPMKQTHSWGTSRMLINPFGACYGKQSGNYDTTYESDETTVLLKQYAKGQDFDPELTYYATVISIGRERKEESQVGEEIIFRRGEAASRSDSTEVPIYNQLKVIYYVLRSYID